MHCLSLMLIAKCRCKVESYCLARQLLCAMSVHVCVCISMSFLVCIYVFVCILFSYWQQQTLIIVTRCSPFVQAFLNSHWLSIAPTYSVAALPPRCCEFISLVVRLVSADVPFSDFGSHKICSTVCAIKLLLLLLLLLFCYCCCYCCSGCWQQTYLKFMKCVDKCHCQLSSALCRVFPWWEQLEGRLVHCDPEFGI